MVTNAGVDASHNDQEVGELTGLSAMPTVATMPCPRCKSTRTICTASEIRFDYWHCYNCGKTFDVEHPRPKPLRRAADTRRKIR